jgi:hypothetical protein
MNGTYFFNFGRLFADNFKIRQWTLELHVLNGWDFHFFFSLLYKNYNIFLSILFCIIGVTEFNKNLSVGILEILIRVKIQIYTI